MSVDLESPAVAITRIGDAHGEPIIVIPGGPCRAPEYLGDLAGIGDVRPLVILHPRGTPLTGGLSRGWWTDADDVVAVIDSLGLAAADVIAHSAGTRLALATAARFPGRVRSMALLTPPASWLTGTAYDGDSLPADRDDPAVAAAISSLTEEDDSDSDEEFRTVFLRQAPASYAHWTLTEQEHAAVGSMSAAAAAAWFDGIPDDVAARILAAPLPATLVVGGDRDLLTGVRPVVDYAAAIGAEARMIEDCGHYPWVEQPAQFREAMEAWFARRAGADPRRLESSESSPRQPEGADSVTHRPEIVCICGSIRFVNEMRVANRDLTFAGLIVLAPGESDESIDDDKKKLLDDLHLQKIDLADRVLIVNPGGYIGESTRREIAHARAAGKPVSFTDPVQGD